MGKMVLPLEFLLKPFKRGLEPNRYPGLTIFRGPHPKGPPPLWYSSFESSHGCLQDESFLGRVQSHLWTTFYDFHMLFWRKANLDLLGTVWNGVWKKYKIISRKWWWKMVINPIIIKPLTNKRLIHLKNHPIKKGTKIILQKNSMTLWVQKKKHIAFFFHTVPPPPRFRATKGGDWISVFPKVKKIPNEERPGEPFGGFSPKQKEKHESKRNNINAWR